MNPATLAETAERMKSLKPEDIDSLLAEMASMGPEQKAQLKSMGMDPAMVSHVSVTEDKPSHGIPSSRNELFPKLCTHSCI